MKSKNLVLAAMSLSLLLACKKQEDITTEVDYKKKLEQEFELTAITSSKKMSNKDNKQVHNFATYEEQYKYLKELVKNTVIRDTVTMYPSSEVNTKLNSNNGLKLVGKNNSLGTSNKASSSGIEQNFYSRFLSKSANSSVSNTFTLTYSVSTTVNWPWQMATPSSPPTYLGYCYFSNTSAYGQYLTYGGFMQLTNYNVSLTANTEGGTANGTAQLFATTGGLSNSVSVNLSGDFTLQKPTSPQSPVMIYYTFKAVEPILP